MEQLDLLLVSRTFNLQTSSAASAKSIAKNTFLPHVLASTKHAQLGLKHNWGLLKCTQILSIYCSDAFHFKIYLWNIYEYCNPLFKYNYIGYALLYCLSGVLQNQSCHYFETESLISTAGASAAEPQPVYSSRTAVSSELTLSFTGSQCGNVLTMNQKDKPPSIHWPRQGLLFLNEFRIRNNELLSSAVRIRRRSSQSYPGKQLINLHGVDRLGAPHWLLGHLLDLSIAAWNPRRRHSRCCRGACGCLLGGSVHLPWLLLGLPCSAPDPGSQTLQSPSPGWSRQLCLFC